MIELLNSVKDSVILYLMTRFMHPSIDDITLPDILGALSDPMRIKIVQRLMAGKGCTSCADATPCPTMAKSTLSHHFRILREAGLVHTTKKGVEHHNVLRLDDVNKRFPGLLKTIFKLME